MKQVWYVHDPSEASWWPQLFDTKLAAEQYARMLFPNETEDKRYARIHYREVYSIIDPQGE